MKEYFKNKAVQSAALGMIILGIVFAILLAFVTSNAKAEDVAVPTPPTEVTAEVVKEEEGWFSEKYRKLKEWASTPEAAVTTDETPAEAVTAVVSEPTVEEAKKKTDK